MSQEAQARAGVQQAEAKQAAAEKAVAKTECGSQPTAAQKAAAENQLRATIQDSGKAKKTQQIQEAKQEERRKAMYAAAAKGDAEVKKQFGEKAVGSPEHIAAKQRVSKARSTGKTRRDLIIEEDHKAGASREQSVKDAKNFEKQTQAKKADASKVEKAEVKKPMSNVERAKARRAEQEREREVGLSR